MNSEEFQGQHIKVLINNFFLLKFFFMIFLKVGTFFIVYATLMISDLTFDDVVTLSITQFSMNSTLNRRKFTGLRENLLIYRNFTF